MHWCPRCRGVLLSPGRVDAPASQRNYRWVARRPDHRLRKAANSTVAAPPGPTPRYTEVPRWGLLDPPPAPARTPARPLRGIAESRDVLLVLTALAFLVAAAAEYGRYLILLRNRTTLIPSWLLWISDMSVWVFGVIAPLCALATALALVGWLIEARKAAFAAQGRRDPRRRWTVLAGCLVPGVNLIWPGVFLTELVGAKPDPRAERAVRIWWAAWVASGLILVAATLWRDASSLQAEADGVSFTAFSDLCAAAFAVLTLWTVRLLEGRDLRGAPRSAHRWVMAADPAEVVIAPVTPGERDEIENSQEEVVAK
ncbi:hypothetical protein NN3_53190 [Nocardia neocaledoniensis NBRC 108232]|uniref:Uncharacterized protein DUF4328 n=2 Tax=Nocardia neocaledoniensis TaxID=236511 RepID=A0A317NLQ4_9NOCA|nr:uncharacterized protein DUF4328 [Nocardia neocaledoniensis]GEM34312.1 hypothetical protein NN3_53190 [Nocardia neocaledoniensis NBRC 108232]